MSGRRPRQAAQEAERLLQASDFLLNFAHSTR
jgi:hypothetical protein